MNKSKRSFYTAVTSIVFTILSGLTGLVVTRIIITTYGSDFNGLNSTVTQFINMMLIIEGGFTLATSVALFKPLTENDKNKVNGILSATRQKFNRIGILFLVASLPISIIYALSIKTNIDLYIVIIAFILLVLSTSFNLIYTSKYRILIQTDQREYVINLVNIITLLFTQGSVLVLALINSHMLYLRLAVFVGAIISQMAISKISKHEFSSYKFHSKPLHSEIKGTRDVFIQRLTSVIFNTAPILFISSTVGTLYASVYFVYSSIITIIKSVIYSITHAPLMSLGKLISEDKKNYIFVVFQQYEYIVNYFLLTLLTVTSVLIIPFVRIYSAGVSDVQYSNYSIAALLLLITFFEMIHIPSGNVLNMAGLFHISRRIQIRSCVLLIVSIIIGQLTLGLNGILAGVLVTSIFLAIQEIVYIYKYYFQHTLLIYFRNYLPIFMVSVILIFIEICLVPTISGYFMFFVAGLILVLLNSIILLVVSIITNRTLSIQIFKRFLNALRR